MNRQGDFKRYQDFSANYALIPSFRIADYRKMTVLSCTSVVEAGEQSTSYDRTTFLQVGLGFWASKTLLSGVEMEVFTELAKHPQDLETLRIESLVLFATKGFCSDRPRTHCALDHPA